MEIQANYENTRKQTETNPIVFLSQYRPALPGQGQAHEIVLLPGLYPRKKIRVASDV
ncbi:hypothetical protein [Parasediminibacterium sp. JCM 36343]|uniref:hypothetical protein n=1 Tax=Parasediminibacterium sp. JCM 36343 TaxID=3374279 RepID=UPI00397858C7